MNTSYYKPSGKVNGKFFLFFVLLMLVGIPLLSIAYIYLIHYIPFIYLNFVIAIGCGFLLGFLVGLAAKIGKARNTNTVLILTLIGMVIMKYIKWCVYIPLIFSEVYEISKMSFGARISETLGLIVNPGVVYNIALFINENGVWGLGTSGSMTTGIMLYIVWFFEFGIMSVLAIAGSWSQPRIPYSEEADNWYVEMPNKIEADVPVNIEVMKHDLENGNYAEFAQFVASGRMNSSDHLILTFHRPPEGSITEPYYLSIARSMITNKNKRTTNKIINFVAINEQMVRSLTTPAIPF